MRGTRGAGSGGVSDLLAVGFGTTVAMWAAGYIGRLPGVHAASWLLGLLFLACLLVGGYVGGRFGERGWRGGALAGLLSSVLNLLVLGSLLSGPGLDRLRPSAVWWVPGSLLAGALLGGVGAAIGAGHRRGGARAPDWLGAFAGVAAGATLLLLLAGGLVTSNQAGLAVVDWPNSFGYNMFLYPLSRMTGGVYYEHAHRLFGSLVGLTTLVLAVHLQRADERRWVRRFALLALVVVIVQGILGGLRVTGHFTLSTSREAVEPSIALAVVHGITGQLFFAIMVALATFTSRAWRECGPPVARRTAPTDRGLSRLLVGVLLIQLVLGAIQRHLDRGLLVHVTLAVVVVAIALAVGVRAARQYGDLSPLHRLGNGLLVLVIAQVGLGVLALAATMGRVAGEAPAEWQALLATAHQGTGALLLACAVALMAWTHRRLAAGERGEAARAGERVGEASSSPR
ncbi:MAG: COX15/CtaA family protein [Acidobacteriota bacterium]